MDEVSRHALFCQLRSQIRHSKEHLIVGIDIAKDRHHAFFGTPSGRTLWRRLIFGNDSQGFAQLIEQARVLMCEHHLSQAVFGLEPTGNYHKTLAHWLVAQGHNVVLVSGKAVKDNRQLIDGRWDKNDTKDSANVADLIGQGKCQFFEQPEAPVVALRTLLSLRKRLKKEEHSLRMQIRNGLVAKHFPELDRLWANCLEENLAIVCHYLDPGKIAATAFDVFVRHVTSKNRGLRQMRRLEAIYKAAQGSVGIAVDEAVWFEAKLLVERHRRLTEQLDETMAHIAKLCRQLPGYDLLLTIPGCGPYIAALLLAAIGNPGRFSSSKQVIRLAGLDLNASRSGKTSDASVPKISKRGDADLRYGLYQAALIGSYYDKAIGRLYGRMVQDRQAERGIKTKARVKLASKLLVIAWTMLKNNEPFDARRLADRPVG